MTTLLGMIQKKLMVKPRGFPWRQATIESGGRGGGEVVLCDTVQLTSSVCLGTILEVFKSISFEVLFL